MFSSVKITAIATLAEDPVIRTMEDRRKMVGLSVYTVRHDRNAKARETRQEKEWHRVVITDQRLAIYAEAHLTQGDQVYLEGGLRTTFWLNAAYERQSISNIMLWQEGDKLKRVTDDPEIARKVLAVASDAHLARVQSDKNLLECVA